MPLDDPKSVTMVNNDARIIFIAANRLVSAVGPTFSAGYRYSGLGDRVAKR